ncbi:MAG: Ig-like domain-containing protein [Clostridium sp.]
MKKEILIGLAAITTTFALSSYEVALANEEKVVNNKVDLVYILNSNNHEEFKVNTAKFKNEKEIEITFSEKIDKDYILYKDGRLIGQNISITGKKSKEKEPVKGTLSEDGKKLTITKIDESAFDGEYSIVLSKEIKSTKGNPMVDFKIDLSVKAGANLENPELNNKQPKKEEEKEDVKQKKEDVVMLKSPKISHGKEKNKNIFIVKFKKEVKDESLNKDNFKVMTKMGEELPIKLEKDNKIVTITVEKNLMQPDKNGLIKIANVKSVDDEMFEEKLQEVELIANKNSLCDKNNKEGFGEGENEKRKPVEEIRIEKEISTEEEVKDNKEKETINEDVEKNNKEEKPNAKEINKIEN